MKVEIIQTELKNIKDLRAVFLNEGGFQFIHNKCHDYNWADEYVFILEGRRIGYGSVWGKNKREERDTVFEFFVLQPFREHANYIYAGLLQDTSVEWIEAQSNDHLNASMLYKFGKDIQTESILFEQDHHTELKIAGANFRKSSEPDNPSDSGEYVLEYEGETVATGGFMLNYNYPYADIYMDVKAEFRRKGFGSLIVQELKKEIYSVGRIPAARCNPNNQASKLTLLKAGFKVCGALLNGMVKNVTQSP